MEPQHFTELIVWQRAHQLAVAIYRITASFPTSEKFGLVSQLTRAAASISANIAEGFKRQSRPDQRHFYAIADGSLAETHAFLLLAKEVGYLKQGEEETFQLIGEVSRLLTAWRRGC
jgi:four helix bundle protein